MANCICEYFGIDCGFACPNSVCPGSESELCPATPKQKKEKDTPIPPGPGT